MIVFCVVFCRSVIVLFLLAIVLPLTNMDRVLFAQEIILNFRRFKPFYGKNERDY
jgi:hypothetical protein